MKSDLILPRKIRSRFKHPLGKLITGKPSRVWNLIRKIIEKENPPRVVCVGDAVSKNSLSAGARVDTRVTDGIIKRRKTGNVHFGHLKVHNVANAKGTISWKGGFMILKAIQLTRLSCFHKPEMDQAVLRVFPCPS